MGDGARTADGAGAAARTLGVVVRVGPQLERDRDGLGAGALDQQRGDGAVDTAAHRYRDAVGIRFRSKDLADRVRERVGRERLAADRRRLEQSQPAQVAVEPFCVGVDDPVSLHGEPNKRDVPIARRIPDDLNHRSRLPPAPPGESPFPGPKGVRLRTPAKEAGRASPGEPLDPGGDKTPFEFSA